MIKELVHSWPILCDIHLIPNKGNSMATVSKEIEKVTCQKCMYYHFRPDAKVLNDAWRNRK